MAAQEWTFNGKQLKTDQVESYWQLGNTITVQMVSGRSESKDFATEDEATTALKKMKNLSIIDDIDGL